MPEIQRFTASLGLRGTAIASVVNPSPSAPSDLSNGLIWPKDG